MLTAQLAALFIACCLSRESAVLTKVELDSRTPRNEWCGVQRSILAVSCCE